MRSLSIARIIPALLGFAVITTPLCSQPDSLSYETVITVGHFDFDCVEDTLIGYASPPEFGVLPDRIHWGMDSALYCGTVGTHEDVTHLVYPDWDNLRGTVTVMNYNQDSLPDIVFYCQGEVGDSSDVRDTALSIVVFGQDDLVGFDSLVLSLTDTLQETPFYALELIKESRFIDENIDTYTGLTSYEMPTIFLDVTEEPAPPPVIFLSSVESKGREQELRSELWPNPTSQETTIRLHPLPPGASCRIEIVGSDGRMIFSESITVNSSGELFKPIDLGPMPSGYYHLIVRSDTEILTTHSLAVIK